MPLPSLPARPASGHKGTFGTVLVVGGSRWMPGAPALCATAALRAGAGLVKIASRVEVLPLCLTIEPCATGLPLEETPPTDLAAALHQADPEARAVVAFGPGLGTATAGEKWLRELLAGPRPLVVDADGLNLLAACRLSAATRRGAPALVLTPHPGEFLRLAQVTGLTFSPVDPTQRANAAAALAQQHRAIVLLKGQHTVISDGTRNAINTTGNAALATAGSGDVLTGLLAGLMAQGMAAWEATVLAAHLHGAAGDLWAQTHGPAGLTARDLAALLPVAIHRYRQRSAAAT